MEKRDLDIILNAPINWRMYNKKTILVSGATGRIGRYIVEALIEADLRFNLDLRVVGLARSELKAKKVFDTLLHFPNISFIYQDINDEIIYDGQVDYIFHTAGPAAPRDFQSTSVETLWAHVNGTHNILEFAKNHKTSRVFYVSTVETYGEWKKDINIKEEDMGPLHNLNSRACYPEAKRLCETMLASYKDEYGIDFCGVHFSHTIGPGIVLDDGRAFAEFLQCSLKGEDIVLYSDGSAMRTYTYVADAINSIFLIMERGESILYNVAAEENLISIRDLANLIANLSPKQPVNVLYSDTASSLPYLPFKLAIMDTTKVRDLGWKPTVDNEHIFKWTLESFL